MMTTTTTQTDVRFSSVNAVDARVGSHVIHTEVLAVTVGAMAAWNDTEKRTACAAISSPVRVSASARMI